MHHEDLDPIQDMLRDQAKETQRTIGSAMDAMCASLPDLRLAQQELGLLRDLQPTLARDFNAIFESSLPKALRHDGGAATALLDPHREIGRSIASLMGPSQAIEDSLRELARPHRELLEMSTRHSAAFSAITEQLQEYAQRAQHELSTALDELSKRIPDLSSFRGSSLIEDLLPPALASAAWSLKTDFGLLTDTTIPGSGLLTWTRDLDSVVESAAWRPALSRRDATQEVAITCDVRCIVCNDEVIADREIDSISSTEIRISIRIVPLCKRCLTESGGDPEQLRDYFLYQLDDRPKLRLIDGGGEGSSEGTRPQLRLVDSEDDEDLDTT